jgi:hypothetical protein
MMARAPRLSVGHDRRRRCGRTRIRCEARGWWQLWKDGRVRELQINSLFCKPICKPDAARQRETGETEPTERDGTGPVRRGHRTRERRPETPEINVIWLITQRRLATTRCAGTWPERRKPQVGNRQQRITRDIVPRSRGLTCADSTADRTRSAGCTGTSQPAVPRPVPRLALDRRSPSED